MNQILAVDIGGTNSRFARFNVDEKKHLNLEQEEWIATTEVNSFEHLITTASQRINIEDNDVFVFGVPGPVEDGYYANLVNISWREIDISNLRNRVQQRGGKVYLINDFISQAFGCLNEKIVNSREIKAGIIDNKIGLSVIGAGTGLGHCSLLFNNDEIPIVIPSEAGQILFSFHTKAELKYKDFLEEKMNINFITNDRIVSGSGLAMLYYYLTDRLISPIEVAQEITPKSETVDWFARFFARSCRNYVLSILPICSVLYLTGGVAINSPFLVDNDIFRDEFIDSTKKDILNKIPIKLTQNKSLGIWGSAQYGLENLNK
jgi:glucokinase